MCLFFGGGVDKGGGESGGFGDLEGWLASGWMPAYLLTPFYTNESASSHVNMSAGGGWRRKSDFLSFSFNSFQTPLILLRAGMAWCSIALHSIA